MAGAPIRKVIAPGPFGHVGTLSEAEARAFQKSAAARAAALPPPPKPATPAPAPVSVWELVADPQRFAAHKIQKARETPSGWISALKAALGRLPPAPTLSPEDRASLVKVLGDFLAPLGVTVTGTEELAKARAEVAQLAKRLEGAIRKADLGSEGGRISPDLKEDDEDEPFVDWDLNRPAAPPPSPTAKSTGGAWNL
jgi:hypothetical protein